MVCTAWKPCKRNRPSIAVAKSIRTMHNPHAPVNCKACSEYLPQASYMPMQMHLAALSGSPPATNPLPLPRQPSANTNPKSNQWSKQSHERNSRCFQDKINITLRILKETVYFTKITPEILSISQLSSFPVAERSERAVQTSRCRASDRSAQ